MIIIMVCRCVYARALAGVCAAVCVRWFREYHIIEQQKKSGRGGREGEKAAST